MLKLENLVAEAFLSLQKEKEKAEQEKEKAEQRSRSLEKEIRQVVLDATARIDNQVSKYEDKLLWIEKKVAKWHGSVIGAFLLIPTALVLLALTRPEAWTALGKFFSALRG